MKIVKLVDSEMTCKSPVQRMIFPFGCSSFLTVQDNFSKHSSDKNGGSAITTA